MPVALGKYWNYAATCNNPETRRQAGFNERFREDQPDLSPNGWLAHLAN
jgi:hypothetical protein